MKYYWSTGVFRWEYVNTVVTLHIRASLLELFYKSNRILLPCLHSLIYTLGGLGEFWKVMETVDYAWLSPVLPTLLVFRRCYVKTGKVLYYIIVRTFPTHEHQFWQTLSKLQLLKSLPFPLREKAASYSPWKVRKTPLEKTVKTPTQSLHRQIEISVKLICR